MDRLTQPTPAESAPPRRRRSKKGLFFRGIVTLLPAVITIFVFVTLLQFVDRYLTSPINGAISAFLEGNGLGWNVLRVMQVDPHDVAYLSEENLTPELSDLARRDGLTSATFQAALADWRADRQEFFRDFERLAIDRAKLHAAIRVPAWIGPLLSILLVLVLGYLAGGFVGRRLISSFDRTLTNIPIVRSVYPYTKQFVDFFLSEKKLEFESVVAAQYPSEGIWSLGFVTSNGLKYLDEALGVHYVTVFIPSSPMPMTGWTTFIRHDRLIPLPISVDEVVRIVVSAGVLIPPSQVVTALEPSLRALERATKTAT